MLGQSPSMTGEASPEDGDSMTIEEPKLMGRVGD
jgi:hypothetical protein